MSTELTIVIPTFNERENIRPLIDAMEPHYHFDLYLGQRQPEKKQRGAVNALALGWVLWLAQIGMAKWWLARFRYGPLEWLWRSATYLNTDIPWKKIPGDQAS